MTFSIDPPHADIRLVCDRRQLSQALTNVVKNAVEAIESRRNRGEMSFEGDKVELKVREAGDQVVIDVTDTGIGLPEEREESSGLTPLERGTLVHTLFEQFYRAWQEQGRGSITAATLPDALALFGQLTRAALTLLPAADRALEETRLLGSIVARGLAERVFELEADAGGVIADRLIEFDLRGPFAFPALGGFRQTTVNIRGKADRIDVFANGSIRVIDYKLGRMPDVNLYHEVSVIPAGQLTATYNNCLPSTGLLRFGRVRAAQVDAKAAE